MTIWRSSLPLDFLAGSVAQLLDRVFPPDEESRQPVTERFDLRANPDLPEIYAVLLAVCDEWRDWRCALTVSAHREQFELSMPVSELIQHSDGPPVLHLRLEQDYRALEYAVRHGFWDSRDELLGWIRSLVTLYFLDKHEVLLASRLVAYSRPSVAGSLGLPSIARPDSCAGSRKSPSPPGRGSG